jgi:hypothetical protein
MIERNPSDSPRRLASAAACCLFWWTTGCSTLLTAPGPGSVFTADPTPGQSLSRGPVKPPGTTATYQVAPTPGLGERLQARPSSLATELFRGSALDGRCQPVPLGIQEVLDMPNGLPATPLGRLGPFEAGVQGIPFSPLLLPDYLATLDEGRLVEGGAILADRGFACGFHSVVYVRLPLSDSEPVAVNR